MISAARRVADIESVLDLIAHIPFKALIADKGYGANALVKAVGK
ncbi:hypothetical protein [Thauera sp. SDU_THAU2]